MRFWLIISEMMEHLRQNPNHDVTDQLLSFANPEVNHVGMTSEVQEQITNERPLLSRLFHFLRENGHVKRFLLVLYAGFLLLQFIGLVIIYLPRAIVCCVRHKVSSYQCSSEIYADYNLELALVLAWITAHVVTVFLCCFVVCKWHGKQGVKLIFHKLKRLPKFWRLIGLLVASGCTMYLMLEKTQSAITPVQTAILLVFASQYLFMVILVPLLNYTPIFAICRRKLYPRCVVLLIRVTAVLIFLVNLAFFLVGFLQLGFKVSGIDSIAKGSWEFNIAFLLIRRLTDVLFFNLIQSFCWTKLFRDDENILSHMEKLEPLAESDE